MGGTQSADFKYAVPIGEKKEGESHIYRNPSSVKSLFSTTVTKTVQDIHVKNFKEKPNKPYLGFRPVLNNGEMLPKFEWRTYGQVETIAKQLGSGIKALDLAPEISEFKDYKLNLLAFYSKNTERLWMLDIACSLYGITTVPIYDTLGEGSIKFVFDETNLTTCFMTVDKIKGVAAQMKKGSYNKLKNIVILDDFNLKEEAKLLEGINWYTWSTIIEAGKKSLLELPKIEPTNIYTFSYTSGTTGDPKGVMISHDNIVTMVIAALQLISATEYVYLSYLPLAHIYERVMGIGITYRAGQYAIFNGNVLDLKTDLQLLKPTVFASVPRLYNKFFEKIQEGIKGLTGLKKSMVNSGINTKLANFRQKGDCKHKMYDIIFSKFRDILGGRCELMISASAPLSKEVHEMFSILMSAPLINAYGQTEGMGAEFITSPHERNAGVCGGPVPCIEFKLLDIPDMDYFSTDKDESGKLCPRGEILVRGKTVFQDYYKQQAKYDESVDAEGWLHSGDIGKIIPGTNALQIIDRRKNMFKLSQGEYIAPEKLEQVYKQVKGIDDIFVYGDSLKSVLVAVINIDKKYLQELAKELKIEGSLEDLYNNEEIKKNVLGQLQAHAKKSNLSGLERVASIYIEPRLFSDLDLITTTFKIKRHQAKKMFETPIENMYSILN